MRTLGPAHGGGTLEDKLRASIALAEQKRVRDAGLPTAEQLERVHRELDQIVTRDTGQ